MLHALFQKDEEFGFNFNLIVLNGGALTTYALNKTCTPAVPWVPKEVTCEVDYMEVMMGSSCNCPHVFWFKLQSDIFSVGIHKA